MDSAKRASDAALRAAESKTLGDLLYADQTHVATSESDWRRVVESIADGDQHALRALYEQTHRIVFTLIMRITNNLETAEEVTLDVFHDVWRKAKTYDPVNGSVVGWVMNQARSRAIDRLRYERRKKRVAVSDESGASRDGHSPGDPQIALHMDQQRRLLRGALANLTHGERQTIELAFFSELTYQEVALRLGQPLGTIKSRIRSGLSKLRGALARKAENI